MSRFNWFVLLLLTAISPAFAQDSAEKLEFGLGITPSMSWVNSNTKMLSSGGAKIKFGFGAKINYKLSEKYALGFEVNLQNISARTHFNKMGYTYNGVTEISNDFNIDYELRYLDIPVLLKMKTKPAGDKNFYGEFGANIGFLMNQVADVYSEKLDLSQVNTASPEEGDMFYLSNADNATIKYDYKINKLRAGLLFGGGVHFILSNGSVVELGVRYNLGLSDIYNDTKWDGTSQTLGVNFGFIF